MDSFFKAQFAHQVVPLDPIWIVVVPAPYVQQIAYHVRMDLHVRHAQLEHSLILMANAYQHAPLELMLIVRVQYV
jgi:hypothetical protein